MAKNSSGLNVQKGETVGVFVFDEKMKEKLVSPSLDWIQLDSSCEVQLIEQMNERSFLNYGVIMVVGDLQDTFSPRVLPEWAAHALWDFVEQGGTLYAEMVDTSVYTTSRLFGFKQDFPPAQEYLKKLQVKGKGTLLQWPGVFIPGFAIDSTCLLMKGDFRETHHSTSELGNPVFLQRNLGKGTAYFSAVPLLSSSQQWMYRPYKAWISFIQTLQGQGLPFYLDDVPIQINGTSNQREKTINKETVIQRGFEWFLQSGILPDSLGRQGVYENIHSHHGQLTKDFRPDCHVQAALAFYLYGEYSGNEEWTRRGFNLLDFIIEEGFQDEDEDSCSYGFWKWFHYPGTYPHQIFTDDNSWIAAILLYLYRRTGEEEYKKRGVATAEALLRTQVHSGLRSEQLIRNKLEEDPLYFEQAPVSFNPHFESIAHTALLQAYLVTNRIEFLETALRGMETLKNNKDKWKWMYSRTAALARYLFPLSLILQVVEDKDPWLGEFYWTMGELKKHQHPMGAIEEADNPDPDRFGKEDTGVFIENGEGIADQLYTNNFLLLNLWEGWKSTGDPEVLQFYNELRAFFCKSQIQSKLRTHNGAWMRAFDLNSQEYYGNLGDTGWGPYCIESGWTQAIILVGLLMAELDFSLMDDANDVFRLRSIG